MALLHLITVKIRCYSQVQRKLRIMSDHSDTYSYSTAVGRGLGNAFATSGEGRITALRVWELTNNYITGFQLKYDYYWHPIVGRNVSNMVEMTLFEGETFVQVSGKYNPSNYISQLLFVTNRGRSLVAGQPTGFSFNHYPAHSVEELRLLSGRADNNGITALGAHWGTLDRNETDS
ncbi:zymogen granule membrane protein 16-like [Chanos chanos]|uniref:Zymogen granule membrane protein 16-like n=1 Tax=Chanos chanos TaxID=29144 RepID=A0A6J2WL90_CHACN|nr:zymogen granule membrane protein 16-like [Chanos chanos]